MDQTKSLITISAGLGTILALHVVGTVFIPDAPFALINLVGISPLLAVAIALGFHATGLLFGFMRTACWKVRDTFKAYAYMCLFGIMAVIIGLLIPTEGKPEPSQQPRPVPSSSSVKKNHRGAPAKPDVAQLDANKKRIRGFLPSRKEK